MTSESGSPPNEKNENLYPMGVFRSHELKSYPELKERLNVNHETPKPSVEPKEPQAALTPSPNRGTEAIPDAPFALAADTMRAARFSDFPSLPQAVQQFRSPFEMGLGKPQGPTKVFLSRTVELE